MAMRFKNYEIDKGEVTWGDVLTYVFHLEEDSTPVLGFTPSCGCSTVTYNPEAMEAVVTINTTAAASEGQKGDVHKTVMAYADDGEDFMRVVNYIVRPGKIQKQNLICKFTLK